METVSCTKCDEPISAEYYNSPNPIPCPSCRVPVKIDVFPAFFHVLHPGKAGEALTKDQASCFYHPQKKADIPCDHCGRFLCSLCDLELNGKHLCPVCLETGRKQGKIVNLDRHRLLYDGIALRLALGPMILVWITIITAPIALYLAIRHWNSPPSIVRGSKIRLLVAMVISGLQILAWAVLIFYLLSR